MEQILNVKVTRRFHDHVEWDVIKLEKKVYDRYFKSYWNVITQEEADKLKEEEIVEDETPFSFVQKIKNIATWNSEKNDKKKKKNKKKKSTK